jgi:hypothetical protein
VPAYVLRRQAALERLLVRLSKVAPGRWAIKGGIGLEGWASTLGCPLISMPITFKGPRQPEPVSSVRPLTISEITSHSSAASLSCPTLGYVAMSGAFGGGVLPPLGVRTVPLLRLPRDRHVPTEDLVPVSTIPNHDIAFVARAHSEPRPHRIRSA